MNILARISLKKIEVNPETKHKLAFIYTKHYMECLEDKDSINILNYTATFHHAVNYLCAEFGVSPKPFYYLVDLFAERKGNSLQQLNTAIILFFDLLVDIHINGKTNIQDNQFLNPTHYYNDYTEYAITTTVQTGYLSEILHENTSREFRSLLLSKSHKQPIQSVLFNGTDYISELIYLGIITEEETLQMAQRVSSIEVGASPEHYLLLLLSSLMDLEPYFKLGLTFEELLQVSLIEFKNSKEAKEIWNNLTLNKLYMYPEINAKLNAYYYEIL